MTEQLTEIEIVNRVMNGEKSLYELIVRRFNPYLYKVGRSYNFNHEDTQDLMQETFINAYKNIDKFENRSSFKTWITQIMLNNCYHKKKKLNYNLETDQEMKEHHDPLYSNKHLETQKLVLNRELGHVIENALNQLQEEYRMVFSLREINGFNVSETAALLNISESNVKTRLSRAKDMLQNQLMQSYQATDLYAFNLIYCDAIVKRVMDEINTL